jgi:hypothetical protein
VTASFSGKWNVDATIGGDMPSSRHINDLSQRQRLTGSQETDFYRSRWEDRASRKARAPPTMRSKELEAVIGTVRGDNRRGRQPSFRAVLSVAISLLRTAERKLRGVLLCLASCNSLSYPPA